MKKPLEQLVRELSQRYVYAVALKLDEEIRSYGEKK